MTIWRGYLIRFMEKEGVIKAEEGDLTLISLGTKNA